MQGVVGGWGLKPPATLTRSGVMVYGQKQSPSFRCNANFNNVMVILRKLND